MWRFITNELYYFVLQVKKIDINIKVTKTSGNMNELLVRVWDVIL